MPRTITVAAIQMDAQPAPTAERLARADRVVADAAEGGAQLIVLPELFNTGYAYSDTNYHSAEPATGPTVTWMRDAAARHSIHLAGSLFLLDEDEIYNALLLFAPDGRNWRYDKTYPWAWERAYFRDGNGITVARTDLGDLGFLICWDVSHPDLWAQYAGRVDMMIIASSPVDASNPTYKFPGGAQFNFDDMGPLFKSVKGSGEKVFGEMINQQTAWLGVPAVNTVHFGHITTDIPNPSATLLGAAPSAPWLLKYLPQAGRMQMSAGFVPACKVVGADGNVLGKRTQAEGEGFCMAEITLPDHKPAPRDEQPPSTIPAFSYLLSDVIQPMMMIPYYRRGARRVWGNHMAPDGSSARRWPDLLRSAVGIVKRWS